MDKILRRWRLHRVIANIKPGDMVLDVGCGWEAKALRVLAPLISKGIGLDFKVEPHQVPDHIHLVAQRFEHFPWPVEENSCDIVLMLAVLEHLEPLFLPAIFQNIKRALKSDGKLILTVPTPRAKPVLEFMAYRLHVIDEAEIRDHKIYYNRHLLETLFLKHKLKIELYSTFQLGMNSFCIAHNVH